MPAYRYVGENGLAAKRLAGFAPEMNLRECVTYMTPPSMNKTFQSGFETLRRCHQKSKTGVSVAPQFKDSCPPKEVFEYFKFQFNLINTFTEASL